MDRQAFKQRMQNLKSYRENNPGKGYWDWKVQAYENAGETGDDRTDHPVAQRIELEKQIELANYIDKINHTDKNGDYNPFYSSVDDTYGTVELPTVQVTAPLTDKAKRNIEGRRGARYVQQGMEKGAKLVAPIMAGAVLPAIASTVGLSTAMDAINIAMNPYDITNYLGFKFGHPILNSKLAEAVSKRFRNSEWSNFLATKNSDSYFRIAKGYELSPRNLDEQLFVSHTTPWEEFSGLGTSDPIGAKTLYEFPTNTFGIRKATNYRGIPGDVNVTEYGKKHLLYGNTSSGARDNVRILSDKDAKLLDMDPYIIGVKDRPLKSNGLYETRPVYDDIYLGNQTTVSKNELRDAILNGGYDKYDYDPNIGIIHSKVVQAYAPGGETGDPEKERFYQATGRSSSGRPLKEGLKPVFSLEDAANMTPIGDAISARDTYNAVKNRDWLSAGLAALTVLPFVPSGLRNVKAAARYIPTVNRTEQSLINQALGNISKKRDYLSDIANSRNRVLEDINTIPYRNRAEQADKIFGTNYSETYDLLDDLYQHRYFDLPEVQPKDMVASGRLQAKPFAEERFNKTGVGAEPNEFDLWVNTGMYRDPMQLANHEMNHYTDYIISRNANTTINNNMLKQLENSLKQTDATSYYRKGTEQKAYMNQLRTMLKQNGDVQNLDEPVSSTLLKKYLDKMSDSDPIKKMFKQHKNINAYTKWFNAIPLLGTTALGANAYFNNNKNE